MGNNFSDDVNKLGKIKKNLKQELEEDDSTEDEYSVKGETEDENHPDSENEDDVNEPGVVEAEVVSTEEQPP